MKRDMNFVRLILLECESNPEGNFAFPEYTRDQLAYHLALLIDNGFIDGKVVKGQGEIPVAVGVTSLTWQGHEFLDDIRSDAVWSKTKEAVGGQFQTISLAVVQELAKSIVRGMLGLT